MKRRLVLLLTAMATMAGLAAWARQKPPAPGKLLVLEWAAKAKMETPPVAVLIEMGQKDSEPAKWAGRATVAGARVVHREGYRFRKDDKLIEPDRWDAGSHRGLRVPPRQPAVAKNEGIATVGVVLHLADMKDDASLTLDLQQTETSKAIVPLKELLSDKPLSLWNGRAVARRISAATPVVTDKTEDDFPAAAYGHDGTLWLAYISYHLKDESRRIEQKQLKEQPKDFKAFYTPEFGDQLFVKYCRDGKWSEPIAVTGPKEDLVRCAIAVNGKGEVWVSYSANRQGSHAVYGRAIGPQYSPIQLGKENLAHVPPEVRHALFVASRLLLAHVRPPARRRQVERAD